MLVLAIYLNLVVWFLAVLAGWMAHRKGRDWLVFGLGGLLMPVVGIVLASVAKPGIARRQWNPGTAAAIALLVLGSLCLTIGALTRNSLVLVPGFAFAVAGAPATLVIALHRREKPAEPPPPPDLSGKRILVVDDEQDAVEFVTAVMQEAGYEVSSALDGSEGLAKAEAEKPDAIILDLLMPGKGGYETFARLRRSPGMWGIPVVMLTGVKQQTGVPFSGGDMRRGLGEEPDAFLEKPVKPETLKEVMRDVLTGVRHRTPTEPEAPVRRPARLRPAAWSRHVGCAAICLGAALLVLGVPAFWLVKGGYVGARYMARRRAFAGKMPYFVWVKEEPVTFEELPAFSLEEAAEQSLLTPLLPLIPLEYELNPDCKMQQFVVRLTSKVLGEAAEEVNESLTSETGSKSWRMSATDPMTGLRDVQTHFFSSQGEARAIFAPLGRIPDGQYEAVIELVTPGERGASVPISNQLRVYIGVNNLLRRVGVYLSPSGSARHWKGKMPGKTMLPESWEDKLPDYWTKPVVP